MNHSTHTSSYSIIELRNGQNKKKGSVLQVFCRDEKIIGLETKIHKISGVAENFLGFGFWSCRLSWKRLNFCDLVCWLLLLADFH